MSLTRVDFYVATKLPTKEKSTVKTFFLTNFLLEKKNQCYIFCFQNCPDQLRGKHVLVIEKKLLNFEAED